MLLAVGISQNLQATNTKCKGQLRAKRNEKAHAIHDSGLVDLDAESSVSDFSVFPDGASKPQSRPQQNKSLGKRCPKEVID